MNPRSKVSRYCMMILLIMVVHISSAQKGIIKQADKYFEAEKYDQALKLYEQVKDIADDKDLLFKRGVANYHLRNADQAIEDLTLARGLGYDDNDIYLYVGMALHSRGSYQDAVQFYKNYLRYLDDKEDEAVIVERIKRCQFAYNNQYNDQLAFVENLGSSVNTPYDEVHPIQSPTNQNKYYFSSNRPGSTGGLRNSKGYKDEIYGNYFADMYAVELLGGNWTAVSAFHPILNGPKNDLIQGFNPSGSVLYFLKTQDGKAGEIYADTFSVDKDPETFPKLLKSPMISELGDKDLQVFNDNTIIFSSRRKGGFGGYDLYIAYRDAQGWSAPENLGPSVNSAYNEEAPFLAKSGKLLYFSSDRLDGFGGYDIFESEYLLESGSWTSPKNLGPPINSPMDDTNFSLSADGMTAIFASDRIGTMGGKDLFLAYYKDQAVDQLMYTEVVPFLASQQDSSSVALGSAGSAATDADLGGVDAAPVEKKEFYNEPLYYGADEIIVTPANKTKLDRIKNILTVFPDVSVVLTGHSIKEGMREFDLYFSIKRAEKAAAYLVEKGVEPSRVKVRGLGSNYPHTKEMSNGSNRLAERNNRRIDVSFTQVPVNRLIVITEMPTVSDAMLDGSSQLYYNTLKGLAYKVQVAKTKQMYKGDVIRQYERGAVEKDYDDDQYLYTIGLYESYQEAKSMKDLLIRSGIIDAAILPLMNDVELSQAQIDTLKDVYPDLGEYLRFER